MATMNISIPDQMKAWVESRSEDGSYSNTSDYMRDLIRRDQERQKSINELQTLVNAGLASGAPQSFDVDAFLKNKRSSDDR